MKSKLKNFNWMFMVRDFDDFLVSVSAWRKMTNLFFLLKAMRGVRVGVEKINLSAFSH